MKKEYWLYGLAVVTGILVWVVVSNASGRREAWDSQWYFLISVPVVCVVSAALGFVEPSKPWRWGLLLLLASFPGCCSPKGRVISCHLGSWCSVCSRCPRSLRRGSAHSLEASVRNSMKLRAVFWLVAAFVIFFAVARIFLSTLWYRVTRAGALREAMRRGVIFRRAGHTGEGYIRRWLDFGKHYGRLCGISFSLCCLQSLQAGDLCSRKKRASRIIRRSMRFLKKNWPDGQTILPARKDIFNALAVNIV